MGTMMIEIPDDRLVHVVVGSAGFAITDDRPRIAGERVEPVRRRRPLLMLTGGTVVLAVGFVLGHHTITSHAQAEASPASTVSPTPPPVVRAFPQQGLTSPGPAGPTPLTGGQVPPALTQQLAQPPQVAPPPGAPQPATQPNKSPFGLDD